MKLLFGKLVLLFILLTGPILLVFFIQSVEKNHYLRAFEDKQELLKNTRQTKIVLIGDSNLPFGVNSGMIHHSLNYPVVNTGIYSSLGLLFELNRVYPYIGRGDVVIISLTHTGFGNTFYSKKQISSLIQIYPKYIFRLSSPRQFHSLVQGILERVKKILIAMLSKDERAVEDVYKRNQFNEYGDYIGHHGEKSRLKIKDEILELTVYPEVLKEINEYEAQINNLGGTCFYTFSPIPKSIYENYRGEIKVFEKNLVEGLNMEFIGSQKDFVYEDSLFYDSEHHLISAGKNYRTETIIRLLEEKLEKDKSEFSYFIN
ncbi:MAG: hypothetical protein MI975_25215 [Cytophagales bacterium]|nr:hypothetical protein [Cytophagales bacterium]